MTLRKILSLFVALTMLLSCIGITAMAEETAVAKVGNTEYMSIDEAIDNWTNGTTLTLLSDVTLSDVIMLSSTEYHILDLGTYTMTAASGKDAIQYVVNGRSSASYALDIKADATNPGGITATGKTIVSHIKPSSGAPSKDRPITRFYGGVFNATYVVKQGGTSSWGFLTSGYTGASAPYFQFYGGEYNGTIYTNRSQNQFHGGTFNGSMQMSVDSSAYTMVAGGTFKNLSNSMGSTLNSDKFTIGSAKGANDGSVCIDENGNYVITTTTPAEAEASVASNYNSSNYFYYSTVNTNGMYYEDVYDALEGNKTGVVTVFADEINLSDTTFEGTIVVPEGEKITIIVEEDTKPTWTVSEGANVTYTDDRGNALEKNDEDGSFVKPDTGETNADVIVEGVNVEIAPVDGVSNSYEITLAEGETWTDGTSVTMTFPAVEGAADDDFAYVVHEHEGVSYIYVGKVAGGSVTITNTVGFSIFTVYDGDLADALTAASAMTGDVTVEIYDKVTLNKTLSGSFSSIKFVGMTENAEIYMEIDGYIEAIGKDVAFEDLTLSKSAGPFVNNAGFMNVAFGVYSADTVTYTKCTFKNGAYASSGENTFYNCTFYRSHDKYGLWAYGNVDVVVDKCTFADYRGIKMYAEGAAKTVDLTVKNTDFSAVTDKPAIVLTYGESVTLENNTYSSTGVFELDLDGAPNGTPVTSDVAPTCKNDNGACGVLVDGKIYTTVAQAAEVATEGSKVTLLHDSTETVEFVEGVELDKNNFEAAGVTVAKASSVAKIGDTEYPTLAEAVEKAKSGDEIVLLADATEDVTVPADIIFNGNGKQVGTITAAGEITFKGHTKATNFGTQYTNTTINIDKGATLELTGTGRMVIGHGCTFNIEGNTTDAKTANTAELTPSLIAPGASFTGAGVNFNVNNAYLKFTAFCSSSKTASGTFNFDVTNSIWEQVNNTKLAFESQSVNATVNFNLKNSVLNTTSHLVFGVSRGEIVIDNSNVNVGTSRQIENQSTMTIKNGSVVNGAVATSSNAKNPGTIIIEDATYAVTGQFSGSDLGTGTLIIKKGANVSVGSIVDKADIVIDATGMAAGETIDFTANLSKFAGTVEVINNDALEAKIVDGKIVLVTKAVAKIGETPYATLKEAIEKAVEGDIIQLVEGATIEEGEIAIPDVFKNITIKGAEGASLKNTHLVRRTGGAIIEGLTIDGVVFDNSHIMVVAWDNATSLKDWTIMNSTFSKNDDTSEAPLHMNVGTSVALENLTFKNNVVKDVVGGSKSGIYGQYTGDIVIENNLFDNIAFRPYVIQLTSDDNIADSLVVTGNTFSGSAAGRAQALTNNAEGTDAINLVVNNNIFKDITSAQQICYWNFNAETTTTDFSKNYYDIVDLEAHPEKIYFNGAASSAEDLVEMGIYPRYTELNEDGTINLESEYTYVPALAKIGDTEYATVADALDAAKKADMTDVTITLVGETTKESAKALDDSFDLYTEQVFDSVTFKQEDSSVPYYIASINTGSRTNGGTFVFDGVNIIVIDQYILEGNIKLINNSVIKSVAEANCFIYNGETTIEPGSKLYGVIEDFRGGDLIIDGGRTDGGFNETPDMQDSIMHIRWPGDSLTVKNGAFLKVNAVNEIGRLNLATGTSLNVSASKVEAWEYIDNAGTINIDVNSTITTKKITGAGVISIDAAEFDGTDVAVIDADMSGFTGLIEVINNSGAEYKIEDGKVILVAKNVASVTDAEGNVKSYTTLEEAFKAATDNCTIDILDDVVIDYKWDCRDYATNGSHSQFKESVTINGNNKKIKFTGEVNDGNWNTVFRFEENAIVKDLTIDISEATGTQRVITAKKSLDVDNLTIIGSAKYGIIFGEGASETDLANAEISIANSDLNGTRRAISDNEGGKDVKTVTITGNTLNANVAVSALETVTFTGNTVTAGYVDIRSYTEGNTLDVTATDNTLTANTEEEYNYIKAGGTVNAQDGFVLPWDGVTISNIDELKAFRNAVNAGDTYAGKTVTLTADIDLAGENWTPIGTKTNAFGGTFNGQNYTISNLNIDNAELSYAGLFGYANGAKINNVKINNVDIHAYSQVGAIAGTVYTGSVSNCHVSGTIKLIADYAYSGGITSEGYVTVTDCSVIATGMGEITVKEKSMAGGITGWRGEGRNDILNCTVKNLNITAYSAVGAITGLVHYENTIDGCTVDNVNLYKTRENGQASIGLAAGNWSNKADDNYTITITNNHFDNISINGTAINSLRQLHGSNYNYYDKVIKLVESGNTYGNITNNLKVVARTLADLRNAAAYANEGETITLLAPIEVAAGETLELNRDVTITYTSNVPGEDMIINRGTLVIDGATLVYTNTDTTANNVTVSTISCEPGSTLEVKSGTVKNDSANNGAVGIYAYAIDLLTNGNLGDVTATISGGEVISTNYMAIRQFNNGDACKNTLNITDGYIYGAKRAIQVHLKNDAAYLTIEGGKIEAGEGGYALCLYPTNATNITVTGGEFIGLIYSGTDGIISGGTFDAEPYAGYAKEGYVFEQNDNGTYGVAEKADLFEFYGASPILSNSLAIDFYVERSNFDGEGYYAEIEHDTANGVVSKTIQMDNWTPNGSYYLIRYNDITAKQITETMYITIYDKDGNQVSVKRQDGVKAYAERQLAKAGNSDELKTTLVDLLNYGAAAQKQFGYRTDMLANANLTEEQKAYASKMPEIVDEREYDTNKCGGTSLVLKDNIKLDVYFKGITKGMYATATYTKYNESEPRTYEFTYDDFVANGSYNVLTLGTLVIADAKQLVTITVYNEDGTVYTTYKDSMNSYLARQLANGDAESEIYTMTAKFTASAYNVLH